MPERVLHRLIHHAADHNDGQHIQQRPDDLQQHAAIVAENAAAARPAALSGKMEDRALRELLWFGSAMAILCSANSRGCFILPAKCWCWPAS
jgi:hypothetical protein